MMKPIDVVFFGTPEFAVPALEALAKAPFCNVKLVITQPDKPVGRHHSTPVPSPIKKAAKEAGISSILERVPSPQDFHNASLGICVAYGNIISKEILESFPLGVLNIHPSLLPKYRGSSPIQAAIKNQDEATGVTIMKLDDKMDHGPIIAQEKINLPSFCYTSKYSRKLPTAGELHDQLAQLGADLLIKILPDYIAGDLEPKPQDDSQASYTKKLSKDDGEIDWKKSPQAIESHIRAMNPWPGAWTIWEGKKLIIWRASLSSDNDIVLEEVQLEGKKRMPFREFLKGHPDFKVQT